MRTKAIFVLTLSLCLFLISCEKNDTITPSDSITTESRNINGYNGISVSTAFSVYVTFSATEESIEIEANENLHSIIDVYKQGNDLVIKLQDGSSVSGGNMVLKAYVKTSDLSAISVSEAASIMLQNELSNSDISIDLSEASTLSGEINTMNLSCSLSSLSEANLSGSAKDLVLNLSDASVFMDYNMAVENLNADLSAASSVYVTVTNTIKISASEASKLYYKGDAVIEESDLTEASSIIKVD